jgi:hypothetical protein
VNSFEYSIETVASPSLAWQIFSNWWLWPKFSDIYGEIRWVEGEPWEPGSRLRIEVVRPVRISVEHLIKSCVPEKRVSWIDRGIGTTIEQWVYFEPLTGGGTRVRTWAEFSGIATVVGGRPIRQLLLNFTHDWYDRYREECDRQGAIPPPVQPG